MWLNTQICTHTLISALIHIHTNKRFQIFLSGGELLPLRKSSTCSSEELWANKSSDSDYQTLGTRSCCEESSNPELRFAGCWSGVRMRRCGPDLTLHEQKRYQKSYNHLFFWNLTFFLWLIFERQPPCFLMMCNGVPESSMDISFLGECGDLWEFSDVPGSLAGSGLRQFWVCRKPQNQGKL